MDEAESLCDNIAIMINGRFVVYGSPGHLKSQYGEGYSISLKYEGENGPVQEYAEINLPYLTLKDKISLEDNQTKELVYETRQNEQPNGLSTIFKDLCKLKDEAQLI
jgi:ABC-type multidrug transport system ATPase subunit